MVHNRPTFVGADYFPQVAQDTFSSMYLKTDDLKIEEHRNATVDSATKDSKQQGELHGFFGGAYSSNGDWLDKSATFRGRHTPVVYQFLQPNAQRPTPNAQRR